MSNSEISVKNETNRELRVRVDCNRFLLLEESTVTFNVKYCGVGFGFSTSTNVEYDVFHIADTKNAFTTIHVNQEHPFRLQNNNEYHATLTVLSKNDDGSWFTIAENHPITKRCNVVIGNGIYVRQNYSFYIESSKALLLHYLMKYGSAPMLLSHAAIFYLFKLSCKSVYEKYTSSSNDYRFGRIVVFNESSKNIWVKVNADKIDVTKKTTKNIVNLNIKTPGSIEASSNKALKKKIYYRANQIIGATLIRKKNDTDEKPTVFYLKSTDNQYYLSIDFENESGTLEQYCFQHPDHLLDVSFIDGSASIPFIIVSDHNNSIVMRILKEKIESFY